jgi:hypothetical protein
MQQTAARSLRAYQSGAAYGITDTGPFAPKGMVSISPKRSGRAPCAISQRSMLLHHSMSKHAKPDRYSRKLSNLSIYLAERMNFFVASEGVYISPSISMRPAYAPPELSNSKATSWPSRSKFPIWTASTRSARAKNGLHHR